MISFFLLATAVNVCPVEKSLECCLSCQAKYLVCRDKSDSLSEELQCLSVKNKCQGECPVDAEDQDSLQE
ncbi:MAG: hypothetical protein KF798_00885 [Candidatus Paracaedibacteraceae bacterium]|nr:hypothetical protein [Candidatus Paracaedibacteraceae bacterium]